MPGERFLGRCFRPVFFVGFAAVRLTMQLLWWVGYLHLVHL
jgi:hypothetical protein